MSRSFNGTSDAVALPAVSVLKQTDAQTQACWVYFNNVGTRADFFNNWSSQVNGEAWLLGTVSGTTFWYYLSQDGTTAQGLNSAITATTGKWWHICGTFDGASAHAQRIYVDGILRASAAPAITAIFVPAYNASLGAGDNGSAPRNAFFLNGYLSDCAYWKSALSISEVMALYEGASPPDIRPNDLMGYWPCNDLGPFVRDYSGRGNHGTLTGTTVYALPSPSEAAQRGHIITQQPMQWDTLGVLAVAAAATPLTYKMDRRYVRR
jgi:hypothetical protein